MFLHVQSKHSMESVKTVAINNNGVLKKGAGKEKECCFGFAGTRASRREGLRCRRNRKCWVSFAVRAFVCWAEEEGGGGRGIQQAGCTGKSQAAAAQAEGGETVQRMNAIGNVKIIDYHNQEACQGQRQSESNHHAIAQTLVLSEKSVLSGLQLRHK